MTARRPHCTFLPPYLVEQLAAGDRDATAPGARTAAIDERMRAARLAARGAVAPPTAAGAAAWTVHTADHGSTLPGTPVRAAGQPASGDAAVDEAAAGIEASLALFGEVYGRSSYDGHGAPVSLTVHYERSYDNAFWDGTQLVFGDGDGTLFGRFTRPVDVLGHELTHAVTERTAGLAYRDQSGALNESVSDVFASCVKQRVLGQDAASADWLIGEGLFLAGVQARALRDMAHPGTAYDDPRLGKDPQVGSMADYVHTTSDNGGVHLNSGIPNRAFQLAAVAIGGTSWEGAGRVWYAALTGGSVVATTDFAGFAAATVAAAGAHADAVHAAWEQVGVTAADGSTQPPAPPAGGGGLVVVRRSGGFLGRTVTGTVDVDTDDPRAPEVRDLMGRIDFRAAVGGDPHPDMYTYEFQTPHDACTVPEQHLTDDLRRLADLVLSDPHSG